MSSLPDYLQELEWLTPDFPREAVEEAIARRDEAIPHLLHSLEWVLENMEAACFGERVYVLHIYAMHLLAQFREPRAFPLIARFVRHPQYHDAMGDLATAQLDRILASTCGGKMEGIQALIEDASISEGFRATAMGALGVLLHGGMVSREEVSAYIGELLTVKLERKPSIVWDSVIGVCADFAMKEHLEAIRAAYKEEFAQKTFDLLEDVEEEMALEPGTSTRVNWKHYTFIENAIEEMEWWDCFDPEAQWNEEPMEAPLPIVRDAPKIGRNDQCPCGSGKKYKKCCGRGGETTQAGAFAPSKSNLTKDQMRRRALMLQALDDQLSSPDTPEVREQFQRLIDEGHSEEDARELMASILAVYIWRTHRGDDYTYGDYVADLERLPEIDWDTVSAGAE